MFEFLDFSMGNWAVVYFATIFSMCIVLNTVGYFETLDTKKAVLQTVMMFVCWPITLCVLIFLTIVYGMIESVKWWRDLEDE